MNLLHTWRITGVMSIALAAIVLAGCTSVGIRTASQPSEACMMALLSGTLVEDPRSGLAVSDGQGNVTPVEWPYGYSARNELSTIVLVDDRGQVVGREGDQVQLGGGLGDEVWYACGLSAANVNPIAP